jgi:hypothetical protein
MLKRQNGGSGSAHRFIHSSYPNYALWKKISLKVAMWLIKQLDPALVEKLDLSPTLTDSADERDPVAFQASRKGSFAGNGDLMSG